MSNVEARIQDILNHTSPQVRPQYLLSDIKEAVEVIERLRCILDEEEAKHNLLNAAIQDLAARIAELEAALRFYADDNYNGYNGNGAHARAALGEEE